MRGPRGAEVDVVVVLVADGDAVTERRERCGRARAVGPDGHGAGFVQLARGRADELRRLAVRAAAGAGETVEQYPLCIVDYALSEVLVLKIGHVCADALGYGAHAEVVVEAAWVY